MLVKNILGEFYFIYPEENKFRKLDDYTQHSDYGKENTLTFYSPVWDSRNYRIFTNHYSDYKTNGVRSAILSTKFFQDPYTLVLDHTQVEGAYSSVCEYEYKSNSLCLHSISPIIDNQPGKARLLFAHRMEDYPSGYQRSDQNRGDGPRQDLYSMQISGWEMAFSETKIQNPDEWVLHSGSEEFKFAPRPHAPGEVFVVGRMARPDMDKWSSNTWSIYSAIQYANKRALMLGMDDRTHGKLGAPPIFADCLKPMAISVQQFLSTLHCLLPVNGGARENWPRAGLEAMAAGVPIVAQNDWGWREMIEHGVTGFLGSNDCELAHYAACLAYDEELRQRIVHAARERLVSELASPETIWKSWKQLFRSVGQYASDVDGIPHAHSYAGTLAEEVA